MESLSLRSNVAWNYTGYFIDAALGIALLAYVVRQVPPPAYGVFLLSLSVAGALSLLDLGLYAVLVPEWLAQRRKRGDEGVSRLLTTTCVAFSGLGAFAGLLVLVVGVMLPGPFQIPHELIGDARLVFALAGVSVFLSFPAMALESAFEAFGRFDRLNRMKVVLSVTRAVSTVAMLLAGTGIVGIATASTLNEGLRLCLLAVSFRGMYPVARVARRYWDWPLLLGLRRSSAWAMLDGTARQATMYGDTLVLGVLGSAGAVALYGAGSKASNQLSALLLRGTNVSYAAVAAHHHAADDGGRRRVHVATCSLGFSALFPMVVLGVLFADPISLLLFGSQYRGAGTVMQWLLVAVLARSVSVPAENILYATGCVPMAARLSLVESAANLALGLALVAGYGAAGLAFATAVTHWCAASGWWLQAGCRAANVPVRAVVGHMTRAAAVPALAMLAVVVPYLLWAAPVAPIAQILVGVVAGLVYLAVWILQTGIPMFRAGILRER